MKGKLLANLVALILGAVVLGVTGCGASAKQITSSENYYLKYNFHYTTEKGKVRGSVANFTSLPGHQILPYGSAVSVGSWGNGFKLIDDETGKKIEVMCKSKFLAGTSLSDYLDLILSGTPVSYTGLSEIDKKGISDGRALKGMTKKGVMIALGYPCPHKTDSPDSDQWNYWRNRFTYYPVNFENGIVESSGF